MAEQQKRGGGGSERPIAGAGSSTGPPSPKSVFVFDPIANARQRQAARKAHDDSQANNPDYQFNHPSYQLSVDWHLERKVGAPSEETLAQDALQKEQESLQEEVVRYVQARMRKMGFEEMAVSGSDGAAGNTIFLTADWESCDKLLIVLQNKAGSRPGIWSRSLCVRKGLRGGSMLPFLQRALSEGFGIVVLNPNRNTRTLREADGSTVRVPLVHSSTPEQHCLHVWDEIISSRAIASHVCLLSYGNGCVLAKSIVQRQAATNRGPLVVGMGLLEASRLAEPGDTSAIQHFIRLRTIAWEESDSPAGVQLVDQKARLGCVCISAGSRGHHTSTAYSILSAMDSVFRFLDYATISTHHQAQLSERFAETEAQLGEVSPGEAKTGRVNMEDFSMLQTLGSGAYGKVILVRKNAGVGTNQLFAMKVLNKEVVRARKQVANTLQERAILQNIDHPFLVHLRFAFTTATKLYLVQDYCAGGTLFYHLRAARYFPEERAQFYAAELLEALDCLHKEGIIYRDVKLENILLDNEGHLQLADFGLCKSSSELFKDPTTACSTFCGTPEYIAPELLTQFGPSRKYGVAVDWWAFGILIYEMMAGFTPFVHENRTVMYGNIMHGPLHMPMHFSEHAVSLVRSVLQRNPSRRLGMRQSRADGIRQHPFFSTIDFGRLVRREVEAPWKPNPERLYINPKWLKVKHDSVMDDTKIDEGSEAMVPDTLDVGFDFLGNVAADEDG